VPIWSGAYQTYISMSASIEGPHTSGSQPEINVATGEVSVSCDAGHVQASFSASGVIQGSFGTPGVGITLSQGVLSATAVETRNVNQDTLTTSITANIGPQQSTNGGISFGGIIAIGILSIATYCGANLEICALPALG
jgi:hypothetical protein